MLKTARKLIKHSVRVGRGGHSFKLNTPDDYDAG